MYEPTAIIQIHFFAVFHRCKYSSTVKICFSPCFFLSLYLSLYFHLFFLSLLSVPLFNINVILNCLLFPRVLLLNFSKKYFFCTKNLFFTKKVLCRAFHVTHSTSNGNLEKFKFLSAFFAFSTDYKRREMFEFKGLCGFVSQ